MMDEPEMRFFSALIKENSELSLTVGFSRDGEGEKFTCFAFRASRRAIMRYESGLFTVAEASSSNINCAPVSHLSGFLPDKIPHEPHDTHHNF
jgi:hypothetical protein